ncbi:ABC transporter ATP-binding protein [Primorskyibacter sp. 2E107]|uniref:ABC transporter ATP-binding protein n=1 Tax=Primorskyibacter sp. 2E107 TaxID=3403458 RepID=UPI003AF81CC3
MAEAPFAPWTDKDQKPLIEFRNVTKRFGDFTAIDDLSLKIYEKEFFALLGPSGCGKTTMMRMLAGFETPTEGNILLNGQVIDAVSPNKRAVNMMFQSYALFPHLSVWENIAFGLKRESKDKAQIDARVEEMLRLTRLTKFAKRKPHQISGGQRQRVALARSLAKAPKLLLLDEPLGALDKKLREETQFELMDIQEKTGTTFVIVTHDQEEAMTVASRVAVMDEGKLVQVATPDVIYEAPNSVYVAGFIGDVNLIRGTASARGNATASTAETAPVADPAPTDAPVENPAPQQQARAPQPNAYGKWLHDTLLAPLLGERTEVPEQKRLPAPSPEETAAARRAEPAAAPEIPEGGLTLRWAEGQPDLIVANGEQSLAGQEITLALRPEKLNISKTKPENAANAVQGKVIDIGYLGNISTYHVELAGGLMVKSQVSNTRRIARRDITWEDTVWLSFTATAGVVLTE